MHIWVSQHVVCMPGIRLFLPISPESSDLTFMTKYSFFKYATKAKASTLSQVMRMVVGLALLAATYACVLRASLHMREQTFLRHAQFSVCLHSHLLTHTHVCVVAYVCLCAWVFVYPLHNHVHTLVIRAMTYLRTWVMLSGVPVHARHKGLQMNYRAVEGRIRPILFPPFSLSRNHPFCGLQVHRHQLARPVSRRQLAGPVQRRQLARPVSRHQPAGPLHRHQPARQALAQYAGMTCLLTCSTGCCPS